MAQLIKELIDKRVKLVKDARTILDKAKSEKRELSAEENGRYETIFKDVDELRTQIDAANTAENREKFIEEETRWAEQSAGRKSDALDPADKGGDEKREMAWGENYRTKRRVNLEGPRASDEYRSRYERWLAFGFEGMDFGERRALQSDVPQTGGYLFSPTQTAAGIIKFVDNATIVRQKATVLPALPAATSLGAVSLDTDPDDADWTAELATGNEDSSMALGKRELKPHPMAKLIKISNTLLRATGQAESLVTDRLAYKHQITAEKAYMTGTGAQQALGIFTASNLGISTGRDVSTGNTTTAIVADNLIRVKYSLKPQYQNTAEWYFHRDAVMQISLLKDGNGQYLWKPGLTAGQSDMILNRPVNQSEYAPNTFTTGLYVGLFGDLSFYWIVDSLSYQIQRLAELYARTNQTGFIGRLETDGMPVLEEAFARVKLL